MSNHRRCYGEEELRAFLECVELVNPLDILIVRDGCGAFPDTYRFSTAGINRIMQKLNGFVDGKE
ncbi:MAG: hypothetical protein LBH13_06485 [Cellulomonadaceae bacterium]|nr:hypothetical protein [Cellulomonadaceae bacterium]